MLEVVLKANNKNITFISGSSTIGANDDFVQSITVKAEIPLTALEELYVKFSNDALGETRQERLLGNSTYGYKVNIPQELIDFGANTWKWQILRRRYSSDRQSYTEIGSYLYTLTVGEGLKNTNGENVTVAELQTLYLSAMDSERKSSQNATNAATSQNKAEEFAGLASTSEINAGISERNAKASEEAALGSRNTAFEAASSASNSAEDAEDAKNAAVEAKDEAVNAKTLAEEAKNAATFARWEAEASKGQAQLAQDMAETAQEKAESARTTAVSAMNMASNSEVQAAMSAKKAQDAANYVSTTVRDVARAKSFDNYGALVNYLKNEAPSLEVPFANGQPFNIITVGVPDLWVSGYSEDFHEYSYVSDDKFLADMKNGGGKLWVGNYQLSEHEVAKIYLGDLQKQTDNRLQTSSKDVVTAINEVRQTANTASSKATAIEKAKGKSGGYASLNASGQVPSEQLPDLNYQHPTDERLTTDSKEIYGAINELDGRLDNIGEVIEEKVEPLVEDVDTLEQVLSQAGVQETAFTVEAYNTRTTAGGKNVLNGSKARLHKVVGNTVACKNLVDIPVIDNAVSTSSIGVNITAPIYVSAEECASIDGNHWRFQFTYQDGTSKYVTDEQLAAGGASVSATDENPITTISYRGSKIISGQYSGIMIAYGTKPVAYQEYFDGVKTASFAGIESGGRNLIPFPYVSNGQTYNGTTYTVNTDGSLSMHGKATGQHNFYFAIQMKVKAGTYTISYSGIDKLPENVVIWAFDSAKSKQYAMLVLDKNKHTFTVNEDDYISFYIVIAEGAIVDDTLCLMLNHGSTALPYTPYIEPTVFDFPKTPTPMGTTIDFENKKIIEGSKEIVLDGTENWNAVSTNTANAKGFVLLLEETSFGATTVNLISSVYDSITSNQIYMCKKGVGISTNRLAIYDENYSILKDGETFADIRERFKAHLAELYASGNPVTVRYLLATPTERDFTDEQKAVGNKYTVWQGGTETVLENDGAEYGANLTLTQEYTVVNEMGQGGGGEGGVGEASVRAIAQEEAGNALTSANAYTDSKVGNIEAVLTEILGV